MKRSLGVLVAVALVMYVTAVALQAEKAKSVTGQVTAIAGDSISIKAKAGEMKLAVDTATKVTAVGAGHKSAAAKEAGKPLTITDLIGVGDVVRVDYTETGGVMHAASIRVQRKAPAR